MDEHRLIIQARNCRERTVGDALSIETFLENLLGLFKTKVRHGPTVVQRHGAGEGVTGFIVGDHVFITFHSHGSSQLVSVEVCAHEQFSAESVRDKFLSHFMENVGNLKVFELNRMRLEDVECEESGCSRRALKNWNGRMVCPDHYDQYREAIFKIKRNEFEFD